MEHFQKVQFIHLTFQEYLTADHINDNREEEIPKLMTRLCDPWWGEVVLLLAGIMGNATPLASCILDHRGDLAEESDKLACLLIAFSCLHEAEVESEVRDRVFDEFISLPHSKALDVIESAFGSVEEKNEEVETLLVNILNNPNEFVQAWGLGFLNEYPQVEENSERLTGRIQQIACQAVRRLPDALQAHIIGALPLRYITEAVWDMLTTEGQVNSFHYLHRLNIQFYKAMQELGHCQVNF